MTPSVLTDEYDMNMTSGEGEPGFLKKTKETKEQITSTASHESAEREEWSTVVLGGGARHGLRAKSNPEKAKTDTATTLVCIHSKLGLLGGLFMTSDALRRREDAKKVPVLPRSSATRLAGYAQLSARLESLLTLSQARRACWWFALSARPIHREEETGKFSLYLLLDAVLEMTAPSVLAIRSLCASLAVRLRFSITLCQVCFFE